MVDENQILKNITKNIKKFRLEKGLTQQQLGELCGRTFDKQHINRLETGRTTPSLKSLIKLSIALGVDPCDLLK